MSCGQRASLSARSSAARLSLRDTVGVVSDEERSVFEEARAALTPPLAS